jgi:hypothetical protein
LCFALKALVGFFAGKTVPQPGVLNQTTSGVKRNKVFIPDSPGYDNYGINRTALDRLINNPEMMI